MTSPPLNAPPLPWRKRHPTAFGWALGVGIVLTVTTVITVVFCVVLSFIKSSDAYTGALARAKSAPAVTSALGAPLHEGWLVSGNIHISGPTGLAELAIPISGPKGQGTLYVEATKHLGEWQYDHLVLQLDSTHERLDLTPPPPPSK